MENENQSNPRFILFLALSAVIFLGWSYANDKLFPSQKSKQVPTSTDSKPLTSLSSSPIPSPSQSVSNETSGGSPLPSVATPVVEQRDIKVTSDLWRAVFSNKGAMLNEWTMLKLSDGNY